MFGMNPDSGLTDYLLQDKDSSLIDNEPRLDSDMAKLNLESFIQPTGMEHIDLISRGRPSHNPTSLLIGERFDHLMVALKTKYDYIVIDAPPILAASDAMVLAQHANKVLIVTKFDHSVEGQLVYAIKQMSKANVQVDGIILNDIQQSILNRYSYHYHYAYGHNS